MADYTVMLSVRLHVEANDEVDALVQAKEQLPEGVRVMNTQIIPGHEH